MIKLVIIIIQLRRDRFLNVIIRCQLDLPCQKVIRDRTHRPLYNEKTLTTFRNFEPFSYPLCNCVKLTTATLEALFRGNRNP